MMITLAAVMAVFLCFVSVVLIFYAVRQVHRSVELARDMLRESNSHCEQRLQAVYDRLLAPDFYSSVQARLMVQQQPKLKQEEESPYEPPL